jgi:hypothetical protein
MTERREYRFGPIKVRKDMAGYTGPVDELVHLARKEKFHDFIKVAERLFPDLSDETLFRAYDFLSEAEARYDEGMLLTEPVSMSGLLDLLPFLGSIAQPGSTVVVEEEGRPPVKWTVTKDGSLVRQRRGI